MSIKTNVIRIIEEHNFKYETFTYTFEDGLIDGISVANKINQKKEIVFKTLITKGKKDYYAFMIPIEYEIDLKKAAKACKEKRIELIPVKDLIGVTGYERGGCSPIALKKRIDVFIEETASIYDSIVFSGGKKGLQIKMNPSELIEICNGKYSDLL